MRELGQFNFCRVAGVGRKCRKADAVGDDGKSPRARHLAAGKEFKRRAELFNAIAPNGARTLKRRIKHVLASDDGGEVASGDALGIGPAPGFEHDYGFFARSRAHGRQKRARVVERVDLQRNDLRFRIFDKEVDHLRQGDVAFEAA